MSRAKVDLNNSSTKANAYTTFTRINGDHPLKLAVPNIYVGYDTFYREGGEVVYFNFELAKEMGLIPHYHPHSLNKKLHKRILETFSLQIINEYDILHNTKINSKIKNKNQYMATRYLQLQHPNKQGKTSGDGRSIWNGYFKGRNARWDISSCGTGATRLSPLSAIEKTFFRSGAKNLSYGCGRADFSEGIISAIFSDIMYKKGLRTERSLAVIRFKDGTAVNVRAAKNLFRPAHIFGYIKRGDQQGVKHAVDYYIDCEQQNENWPQFSSEKEKYQYFLQQVTDRFAQASAKFESEYIFCWLDWDGDNILMDGGIIDYGTIRKFGLFHNEYRYEDVDKYSTTITEQKNKAKMIIRVFAQGIDFILSGKRKNLSAYGRHPMVIEFNQKFERYLLLETAKRIGFTEIQQNVLISNKNSYAALKEFQRHFRYFEKAVSKRKAYRVADGITRDAIFCMSDFLRQFPQYYQAKQKTYSASEFIEAVSSKYSSRRDKTDYLKKSNRIKQLQNCYLNLISFGAQLTDATQESVLSTVCQRSTVINRYDRLTGNAIITIAERVLRMRARLSFSEMQGLIHALVDDQICDPDYRDKYANGFYRHTKKVKRLCDWATQTVKQYREGI